MFEIFRVGVKKIPGGGEIVAVGLMSDILISRGVIFLFPSPLRL